MRNTFRSHAFPAARISCHTPPVCVCVYARGDVIYTITTQEVHQRPGCHITPYGVAMTHSTIHPHLLHIHPHCTAMVGTGTKDPTSARVPRQQEINLSLKNQKKSRRLCPLEGMVIILLELCYICARNECSLYTVGG